MNNATNDRRALIVVDVQNDFLPGGALAVPHGGDVLDPINALMDEFDLIVATQDWHPADHGSFAANHPGKAVGDLIELGGLPQVLWPTHCVALTPGAAFSDDLDWSRFDAVFRKGTDPAVDSYSGFYDNGRRRATGLGDGLRAHGVISVTVVGLATDYCVKATALDALADGFDVTVIPAACRGVNRSPDDSVEAIESMRAAGVRIV